MKRNIAALLSFLLLTEHAPAFAHAGCEQGPFAAQFSQFLAGGFKIRELTPGTGNSFITDRAGRRLDLDVGVQAAVRRLAGAMATRDEDPSLYAPVGTTEMWKHSRGYLGDKVNNFFGRRFWIELIGTGVEALYEFGLAAAVLIVVGETLEHSVNITPISFCAAIYGVCAVTANEIREVGHLVTKPYPVGRRFDQRVALWLRTKRDRFDLWRSLSDVRRDGETEGLNTLARRRSYRDFSGGMHTLYGGWLRPGFFRGALVRPICEDCAPPIHRGLRYGRFGRPERSKVFNVTGGLIPEFADLGPEMPVGERVLRTEEYIALVALTLRQARGAASDLTLVDDGLDWPAWRREVRQNLVTRRTNLRRVKDLLLNEPWPAYERGLIDNWWTKGFGFIGLRRDLARMRKSFRLYTVALRLRAYAPSARTADEAAMDADFAKTLEQFLVSYDQRVAAVRGGTYERRDRESALFTAPKRALRGVTHFMKTGAYCETALVGI